MAQRELGAGKRREAPRYSALATLFRYGCCSTLTPQDLSVTPYHGLVYLGKNLHKVHHYPWFQASAGGLGVHPWTREMTSLPWLGARKGPPR